MSDHHETCNCQPCLIVRINSLRVEVERLTTERDKDLSLLKRVAAQRDEFLASVSRLNNKREIMLGQINALNDEITALTAERDAIEAATIERCAKVCYTIAGNWKDFWLRDIRKGAGQCAAAIRALKERQG